MKSPTRFPGATRPPEPGGSMQRKKFHQMVGFAVVLVAVAAASGLPTAIAGNAKVHVAADSKTSLLHCIRFDVDDKPACGIMRRGPRGRQGFRGKHGETGPQGVRGLTGATGL